MNKKVLVIDDDNFIRELILEILKAQDFEVHEACNAFEGLKVLKEVKPDLIITDIHMPEMTGIELIARIKKAGVIVKIIVISGEFMKEGTNFLSEARNLGVDAVMKKPISETSLRVTVKSLFSK
jgi:YesN/AraC family two-component response regulator